MTEVAKDSESNLKDHSDLEENLNSPNTLKAISFFSELSEEALGGALKDCRWETHNPGDRIIERGQEDKDVYFLLDGNAHVLNFSPSGKVVSYSVMESGSFFGELAAIDDLPRSATVVAKTECSTAILTAVNFLHFITEFPHCLLTLVRKHAGIIRAGNERIADFSLLNAEQRICLELLRLAEPDPVVRGRFAVNPVPTQEFIAETVGVTRQTVARIFSKLITEKAIRRHGKFLYIENDGQLEMRALQASGI